MARSRTCRCDRWPIWHTDDQQNVRCLKCGRDKPHLPPTHWRKVLAVAGRVLGKQAA